MSILPCSRLRRPWAPRSISSVDVRRYATRHQVGTRLAYDGCALSRVVTGGDSRSSAPGSSAPGAVPAATAAPTTVRPHLPRLPAAPPTRSRTRCRRPGARRCLPFPLYPALIAAATNQVAKTLATLP